MLEGAYGEMGSPHLHHNNVSNVWVSWNFFRAVASKVAFGAWDWP